jgi:hypothetical protein
LRSPFRIIEQDSTTPPEDDGGGYGVAGHSAAMIAGADAAPVLESAEHVLDLVPVAAECGVVFG